MNIYEIFTKKNLEILDLISKEKLHIRDIADRLKCSSGTVHKAVNLFKKNDFVELEKRKNMVFVNLKNSNILLRIRSLLNISKFVNLNSYKKLLKYESFGLYGSFVEGNNDEGSDIDLWIYGGVDYELIRNLEKEIGFKINVLKLTDKKLKSLKKNDYEFYLRLKLTSFVFGGDIFD